MGSKPSTKSSGDPAAVYGTGPSKGIGGKGTMATAMSASDACAHRDPLVKYCPHDGK